jgi:transketolase
MLVLTRQNLPTFRTEADGVNRSARGAYVVAEAKGSRAVTLLATGSELAIALDARDELQADGIAAAVVSMPCWELFDDQDDAYRQSVLGDAPRVAVEAGVPFGWTRYVASEADVIGMTGYGASGPIEKLYPHFGITSERVAARARELV